MDSLGNTDSGVVANTTNNLVGPLDDLLTLTGTSIEATTPNFTLRNAPRTSAGSYADALRPAPRQELENKIRHLQAEGIITYDSGQLVLTKILSSALLFNEDEAAQILNAWDNRERIPEHLYFLLDAGLHRHGQISDYENFWALHKLSANHEEDAKIYLVLGLCLFIMDMVSRFPNSKNLTFFSACRKNGFKLGTEGTYDRQDLERKFIAVLTDLELYTERHWYIKKMVGDWFGKGAFAINDGTPESDVHYQHSNGKLMGTYVLLANILCRFDKQNSLAQLAFAIIYALGNKENMQRLVDRADNGLENCLYTMGLINDPIRIAATLKEGDRAKFVRGIQRIRETFPNAKRNPVNVEGDEFIYEALTAMPPEFALPLFDVMEAEHESITYIPKVDSRDTYPKEDIPGRPHGECEKTRRSSGRIPRFYRILICQGNIGPREEKILRFRHTAGHELTHTILSAEAVLNNEYLSGIDCDANDGHLPGSYIRAMKERLADICERIDLLRENSPNKYKRFFGQKSVTDGFEIGELLSKDIPTYMFNGRLTQYDYPGNTYDEERWANAIGFACGQCAPDVRPHDNAFHGPQNPNDPEVVNELREFTSESAQFFSLARDLVCKKAQAQDMRSSVQSFHRNSANSSGICSRT